MISKRTTFSSTPRPAVPNRTPARPPAPAEAPAALPVSGDPMLAALSQVSGAAATGAAYAAAPRGGRPPFPLGAGLASLLQRCCAGAGMPLPPPGVSPVGTRLSADACWPVINLRACTDDRCEVFVIDTTAAVGVVGDTDGSGRLGVYQVLPTQGGGGIELDQMHRLGTIVDGAFEPARGAAGSEIKDAVAALGHVAFRLQDHSYLLPEGRRALLANDDH